MRLILFLMILGTLHLNASLFSQEAKFVIEKEDVALREIFKEIENQSDFRFFYNDVLSDVDRKFSFTSKSDKIEDVLDDLLENTDLSYKVMSTNLILISPKALLQQITVTGTIVDEDNNPLPGVNVVEKGTTNGAITDLNGKYSIVVSSSESVLEFSFVGYISESIAIGTSTEIDITLIPSIEKLEEVIVVGYGTTSRANFTGSVTQVKTEDTPLALIPNTDVMDVLRGTVPGMTVSQQQGAGQSPNILIRGQKSIGDASTKRLEGTEPLIVLDGVIFMGSIRDIDPKSIESINVLKDATTVAAYGSRAANGVIMINTKKGKTDKPIITFQSSFGFLKTINRAEVLSPEDYVRKVNLLQRLDEDADPTTWMSDFEDENYLNGITTDWQDFSQRTGNTQNYSLSLSGATDRMDYYLSGSYTNTQGVMIGDDYNRSAVTSRLTTDITDWLEVGGNFNFSFNDYSGPTNYDIYQSIRTTPYGRIYRDEEKGLLEKYPAGEGIYRTNPLWNINSGTIDDHDVFYTTILGGHALVKVPWIEGLSYRINYSYTYRAAERDYFTHEGFYIREYDGQPDDRYEPESIAENLPNANGYRQRIKDVAWVWDNIINYKRTFGKHNIDLTAVYTRDLFSHYFTRMEGSDFSELGNTELGYNGLTLAQNQTITLINNANNPEHDTKKSNIGYLGRVNYSFDNKYHFSASIRRDGASVFGADNKWGTFPALGFAWTVSDEGFMNNIRQLNYLKLKFSWGKNGNQSLVPYQTLSTITLGQVGGFSYPFGNISEPSWGQRINQLGNTYLKWEETTAINAGFELRILNNRIALNMDAYKSKTADQIFRQTIPVMGAGITEIDATAGQIDNWGIEATLNTQNIVKSNFSWNSSLIFFMNRNKIVELDGSGEDNIEDELFIGESLGAIYGYNNIGIVLEVGDEEYIEINGAVPGDVKFQDIDGNDTINENDRTILGFDRELFRLSFANTFRYKNFELYMLFTGIFGGKDYYKSINLYAYRTMSDVSRDNNLDHIWWTPENKSNTYPRIDYTSNSYTPLQSRTFVRLQNLSLSYTFNQQWVEDLKIHNLKLYISATNLFTITGWEGGDPEIGQTLHHQQALPEGEQGYGLPLSATYLVGINLTF